MQYTMMPSPVGALLLAGAAGLLRFVVFATGADRGGREPLPDWQRNDAAFASATQQLREYFAGERRAFDLALSAAGTPFQRSVQAALRTIPYGETRSYSDIAAAIGRPKAVRAVGAANARNPLPIVVPCHRVIGKHGALTGFGGGLPAKRHLLALERRVADSRSPLAAPLAHRTACLRGAPTQTDGVTTRGNTRRSQRSGYVCV